MQVPKNFFPEGRGLKTFSVSGGGSQKIFGCWWGVSKNFRSRGGDIKKIFGLGEGEGVAGG